MDRESLRVNAALSVIQGVLEAKWGEVAEFLPEIAVKEAFRIADKFVEYYFKHYKDG